MIAAIAGFPPDVKTAGLPSDLSATALPRAHPHGYEGDVWECPKTGVR